MSFTPRTTEGQAKIGREMHATGIRPEFGSWEYQGWLDEDLKQTGDLRTGDGLRLRYGNYAAISPEDKADIAKLVFREQAMDFPPDKKCDSSNCEVRFKLRGKPGYAVVDPLEGDSYWFCCVAHIETWAREKD
jgi:hypothetical protein